MHKKVSLTLLFFFLINCYIISWSISVLEDQQSFLDSLPKDKYQLLEDQYLQYSLFVSPDGSDSNSGTEYQPFETISKAAEVAQAGDIVLIKRGTYLEFTVFENSGTEKNPIMFIAEEGVVVEGPETLPYWGGIFEMHELMYITISGFHLRNSNWFGIMINYCSYITIDSCFVENTEASGIYAYNSDNIIIKNNKVRNACACTHACGVGAQECITVAQVDTFQVIYNEVYDSSGFAGGEGIDAKEGCSNGEIAYNLVHDIGSTVGIYVDSWDALLTDVQVYGNILFNNFHGIAISSENGGTARKVKIYNNLVFDNINKGIIIGDWGLNGPREDITITSNTVVNNGDENQEWAGGITIQDTANLTNVTIRNNIVSGNKHWQIMADYSDKGVTCDHNLINGFRGYQYETRGETYQEGEPGFMNITENNFALQENSIAIDKGELLGAPTEDIIGNKRPYGNGIDIGAYEYIEPLRIDGNIDFKVKAVVRNWRGDGSSLAPYVIKGLILTNAADNLIEIQNTDVHFSISECLTSNSYYGIYLSNVTNGHISTNTIKNHQFDGIYLHNVSNCVIEYNSVHSNSGVGVRIYQSNDNYILRNDLYNHKWSGININGSTNNVVVNNSVHNTNVGIELYSSRRNNITGNILYKNVFYGITINSASEDNTVKWNDLRENGNLNTEVADEGQNNTFENNYYEDWMGIGSYTIDGATKNQDPLPLVNPYHLSAPTITYPNNNLETLNETVLIHWTHSSDTFSHSVKFSISFSNDDGNTWNPIAEDFVSTSYSWDVSSLNTGIVVLLKVYAECSAGFISSSGPAGPFTITIIPENPEITSIGSPSWIIHLALLSLFVILFAKWKKRKDKF